MTSNQTNHFTNKFTGVEWEKASDNLKNIRPNVYLRMEFVYVFPQFML